MKFLIAASFLCLAFIGQTQGGSLRGPKVPIPHQVYGVPVLDNNLHIEETKPVVEDKETTVVESVEPIVSLPSVEYGAPAVAVEKVPFVDSLPLVDSVANFGISSETYVQTTPKPELPYLKPGLPALPEPPFIPVVVEEPVHVNEVSNAYLPPVEEVVVEEYKPSQVYGPPAVPVAPPTPFVVDDVKPSEVYGTPSTPVVEEYKPSEVYGPPAVPVAPPTPFVVDDVKPSEVYGTPPTPVVEEYKPSEVYGPPAVPVQVPQIPVALPTPYVVDNVKPSEVYGPPAVPAQVPQIPVVLPTPHVVEDIKPSEVYGPPPTPVVEVYKPNEVYGPPAVPVPVVPPTPLVVEGVKPTEVYGPPPTPEVPKIPELPALPVVPVTPPTPVIKEEHQGYVYVPPTGLPVFKLPVEEIKPQLLYGAPLVGHQASIAQVHIAPAFVSSHVIDIPRVPTGQILVQPNALPEASAASAQSSKGGYLYNLPTKDFPTPVSVPVLHKLVSHSGFSSSSSSSRLQVNQLVAPNSVQSDDSVVVEELKPSGPGYTIHSVSGNSLGAFNQVSVINHDLGHLSVFGAVKPPSVPVPHLDYGVPNY